MFGVPLTSSLVKNIAPIESMIILNTMVNTGLLIQTSGSCILTTLIRSF